MSEKNLQGRRVIFIVFEQLCAQASSWHAAQECWRVHPGARCSPAPQDRDLQAGSAGLLAKAGLCVLFCSLPSAGPLQNGAWRDWSGRTLHPPASSSIILHHPASSCILLQHEIISASSSLASAPANFLTGPPRGRDAPARTWAQGPLPSPLHLCQGTWHVCPGISDAPAGFSPQPQKPQRALMTLSPAWSPVN